MEPPEDDPERVGDRAGAADGADRGVAPGGVDVADSLLGGPSWAETGADDSPVVTGYDARPDIYELPAGPSPQTGATLDELLALLPPDDGRRALDDWGRSESVLSLAEPILNFYYRYWFRVEQEGIENVPAGGGALLVANHSGALPPDAPMIMQAIRNEHPNPRPLYMLGEHWFKGYPGVGMLANKIGLVAAHPANAQRLLGDEGRLALVFPEGQKGTRKLYWQRYKLRRFGRGGFVKTAIRARVPIVPVAVVGAEESMPIFAHWKAMQRLTGLIYFPVNHAFPHFGLLGGLMYLPAKFRIRFLAPVEVGDLPLDTVEDVAAVGQIGDEVRGAIQAELEAMLDARRSVWFG